MSAPRDELLLAALASLARCVDAMARRAPPDEGAEEWRRAIDEGQRVMRRAWGCELPAR